MLPTERVSHRKLETQNQRISGSKGPSGLWHQQPWLWRTVPCSLQAALLRAVWTKPSFFSSPHPHPFVTCSESPNSDSHSYSPKKTLLSTKHLTQCAVSLEGREHPGFAVWTPNILTLQRTLPEGGYVALSVLGVSWEPREDQPRPGRWLTAGPEMWGPSPFLSTTSPLMVSNCFTCLGLGCSPAGWGSGF